MSLPNIKKKKKDGRTITPLFFYICWYRELTIIYYYISWIKSRSLISASILIYRHGQKIPHYAKMNFMTVFL